MGALELLATLEGAGLHVTVSNGHLLVRPASKLTEPVRAALRAHKPELLELLGPAAPPRPFRLTSAEAAACHRLPWDDAACTAFATRLAMLLRQGFDACDADDLAERLTLRDIEQDDRRMCVECAELAPSGRCLAAARGRLPGADPQLEPDRTRLHRCPAFRAPSGPT